MLRLNKETPLPLVESFSDYPGRSLPGLRISALKWTIKEEHALRVKIPKAHVIKFFAYTKNGVTEAKQGGKHFIRFVGDDENINKEGFYGAVEDITLFCVDIWRLIGVEVTKRLLGSAYRDNTADKIKTVIVSGLPDLQTLPDGQLSYTFFLHNKYTKCYKYEDEQRKPSTVSKLNGRSGNSNFQSKINIKTMDFTYDPISNTIQMLAFVNVNELTWLNEGQECENTEAKEAEEAKALAEAQAIRELSSYVSGSKGKNLKRKHEGAKSLLAPTKKGRVDVTNDVL